MASLIKRFLSALNPLAGCKRYGISTWQCPQFLFLVMGFFIMALILITYFIAALKIDNPTLVCTIVLSVGTILIIIDYIITNSMEQLAKASRLKTEFVGIVSHQLKSPITNLKYALETILSDKTELMKSEQGEYFQVLRENIKRMNALVEDLLTASKIETNNLNVELKEVSLVEITKKIVLNFKPLAEASNVKVRLKAQNNIPNVMGDPLWVEQVVENLLDNAIRYIEKGGEVVIKIEPKKNKVCFSIQDSGCGIPKEDQGLIFKRFFRSRTALQNQTQGSGLGLYIAKKVLEMMKGKIWFKSQEGKGTTFYFTLPISQSSNKGRGHS